MNESDYERMAERRRARQKKRRHQVLMMKGIILAVLVVVLVIASSAAWHFLSPSGDAKKNPKANNLTASSDTKNTENTSAGETEAKPVLKRRRKALPIRLPKPGFWPPVTTMTELLIF